MDSLVLDIGGDVGALVITTGPDLAEEEIEISPGVDPTERREHNVVHARRDRDAVMAYAAVFPGGDAPATTRSGTTTARRTRSSPSTVDRSHSSR